MVIQRRQSFDMGTLTPAFAAVGRYMYHFGQLELALAEVICVLLSLNKNAARLLLPHIYFSAKLNIIDAAIPLQKQDAAWQRNAKSIVVRCKKFIDERNMFCHGAFSIDAPETANITFDYVNRHGGPPALPVWQAKDFDKRYEKLAALERDVSALFPGFRPTNFVTAHVPRPHSATRRAAKS